MPISSVRNTVTVLPSLDADRTVAEDFYNGVTAWAEQYAPDEQRAIAAERIVDAYLNKRLTLDLSKLNLTSLPTHIASLSGLMQLNLSTNQLTDIEPLRNLSNLIQLDLPHNQLSHIDALSNLTGLLFLELVSNKLTSLRALSTLSQLRSLGLDNNAITDINPLSALTQLGMLTLSNNQITDASPLAHLSAIEHINISQNRLTYIPPGLLELPKTSLIYLISNRFSEAVIRQVGTTMNRAEYNGPRLYFSIDDASAQADQAQPLTNIVAQWYQATHSDELNAFPEEVWREIANEPEAHNFSLFLERLYHTVNSTKPVFQTKVLNWLARLEKDPALRKEIFLNAKEGLGTCEDRVSLTFNAMKQRELVLNVERGMYDQKLESLISVARQIFRLTELEKIAYEKVQRLNFIDEVEVYFAYQVKLAKELKLDIDTSEMRFFEVSYVTESDLKDASRKVRDKENKEFSSYLASWAPWQSVLKRLAKEKYDALQVAIYKAKKEQFADKQIAMLKQKELADTEVNRLEIADEVLEEIAQGLQTQFTKTFIREQEDKEGGTPGLSELLNPVW